jgi:hypothetical protein
MNNVYIKINEDNTIRSLSYEHDIDKEKYLLYDDTNFPLKMKEFKYHLSLSHKLIFQHKNNLHSLLNDYMNNIEMNYQIYIKKVIYEKL